MAIEMTYSVVSSVSAEPRRTGVLTEVDYQIHLLVERIRVHNNEHHHDMSMSMNMYMIDNNGDR
jgi:hypothetical protein